MLGVQSRAKFLQYTYGIAVIESRAQIGPIVKARSFLEAGETLSPFAFVGNFSTQQIIPILINATDDETKDRAALAIQAAAAQINADFVFTIMEAWGLPKDKLPRYQEIRDRYERKLVKQIEVASLEVEGGHNKGYVKLLSATWTTMDERSCCGQC